MREKFEKEAQLLCRLDHPNICRIIDYLPDELALVVPFIDGKDCEKILRESGALPEPMFLKVSQAVLDAVVFAHQSRIAHRDIKPANILIDNRGQVYLIDFGIAKEIGGDTTKTGYVALTPQFAAPERQFGERNYNPFLSDIYELGVTFFILATNEMPYRNAVNPSLRDWDQKPNCDLSPPLYQLLKKALHPNPKERYQSAEDMAIDLKRVNNVYRRRSAATQRRVLTSAIVVAAAAIMIMLTSGIWKPWFTGPPATVSETLDKDAPGPSGAEPAGSTEKPQADQPNEGASSSVLEKSDTAPVEPGLPNPHLHVVVTPSENAAVTVDGSARAASGDIEVSPGRHTLRIVHPDYPLIEKVITVGRADTSIVIELASEFAAAASLDLRFSVKPPLEDGVLDITMNGTPHTFESFPTDGLMTLAGKWQIELKLKEGPDRRSAKIDSCVSFPYGGGPHAVVRGAHGSIDFSTAGWQGKKVVPILVFWSES
ncbi:MAG: protein kinase [candidate division Zixibacteria bacterium]|nr:protein kinase [candidate division Zixibacteria bacterium]